MSYLKVKPFGSIKVDLAAGYLSGVSTIHIDGFTNSNDLLKAGSSFVLEGSSNNYIVSNDVLIVNNEATIAFTPATDVALLDNTNLFFRTDITDKVIDQFNPCYPYDYLEEADNEIFALAQRLGVMDSEDIYLPLHYTIKKWAIAYLCMRIAEDKIGVNNTDLPETEKYMIKFNLYKDKYNALRNQITYEMFINEITSIRDTVVTMGALLRG